MARENDLFEKVVRRNVLQVGMKQKKQTSKLISPEVICITISADKFPVFIESLGVRDVSLKYPISIDVIDEGPLDYEDFFTKETFVGVLNRLPLESVRFHLSDEQFGIYSVIMQKENWSHEDITDMYLTIDRNPLSVEAKKKMEIEECKGKIHIPDEKLIWFPGKSLIGARSSIGSAKIAEIEALKKVVSDYANRVNDEYDMRYMDEYALTQVSYDYIRNNVRFPSELVYVEEDGTQKLKPGSPTYIFSSYGTYKNREGVCSGQTKLMQALLSNKFFNIDSTPLIGYCPQGRQEWLGVVIDGKMFQCCPTLNGPFAPVKKLGYVVDEDDIYSRVYPTAYLTEEDRLKLKSTVNRLRLKK